MIDGVFVSAGASIKHPAMPPQPKNIRYGREILKKLLDLCFCLGARMVPDVGP